MKRSPAIALLLLCLATPGMSQPLDVSVIPTSFDVGQLSTRPQLPQKEPIIAPPLVEVTEAYRKSRQRGIIVGKDIAANMTVGFGFVDRKPRRSSFSPNHQDDSGARRSRKASMLLILKF